MTLLSVDFSKAFDTILKGKMENTARLWSTRKKNCQTIMSFFSNTKAKVHSPHGDTNVFDGVAGDLQEDSLTPNLYIICLNFGAGMLIDLIKENGFTQEKPRSRRYSAETITDADYANDRALLANTPTKSEPLLHSL